MNHLISLASTFSRSRFPRTLACLGGALFLMIASVLWQPGKSVQAHERLTMIPPPSIAQSLSTPTHAATPTPSPSPTLSPGTICGRLRPHSLDDILAAIPTLPTVRNVIIPSKGENPATDGPAKLWGVIQEDSRFDDSCNDRLTAQQTGNPTFKVDDQKKGFCCKNSLTTQDVVTTTSSSLLQNVAKIFFATEPKRIYQGSTDAQDSANKSL